MRKLLLSALAILFVMFSLAACSGKEKENIYTKEENGINITMTFYYKGDTVTRQVTQRVMPYNLFNVASKKAAESTLKDQLEEVAKNTTSEGIIDTMEFTDTAIVDRIEIDYSKANIETVAQLSGVSIPENFNVKKPKISMKNLDALLIQSGYAKEGDASTDETVTDQVESASTETDAA